tara:strand:- start:157 stop:312 length:156 start_codon:yes stop_codon:yes gene_type:complete
MFGLGKNKKKGDLKINKKKSLFGKIKNQTGYKNYVINGGEKSFEQWKKGER